MGNKFSFSIAFLICRLSKIMGKVLGIFTRVISTHLIQKDGFKQRSARTDAVTFIQRFGSALNLNVHFHILFLDGVYIDGWCGSFFEYIMD
jgi:hypothetical protein